MPPGKLRFVDIDDVRCDPIADAFSCSFRIMVTTETGELTSGRGWGNFAYQDGALEEIFAFG